MDDVFDSTIDDKCAEMELANQEWAKKMHDITITGEREALSDAFETRLAEVFDNGLNTGFEVTKDFGILEGRLLFLKSKCSRDDSIEKLLSNLRSVVADVIRELAFNKQYFNSLGRQNLPPDIIARANAVKDEVIAFIRSHK
ncbi:unnamed protein product [Rodentolepis nana]|uniref:DHC_N1 domain-containing protein n=1 Tax=Rodentolepis nana TaxID=102285 RepID=A0A0R3TEU9_RODNA|nr:unnamed protein product [Rodentolepis nana]